MSRLSTPASSPATLSSPEFLGETQWIMRMVVVFPAPFGPRKPKHSPSLISNEMPSTAVKPLNFLTRSFAATIDDMADIIV